MVKTLSAENTYVCIDQLWEEASLVEGLQELKPELLSGAVDLKKVCLERGVSATLESCIKVLRELDTIGIDFMSEEGRTLCKMAIADSRETGLNPLLCLKCENVIDMMYNKMGDSYMSAVIVICNSIKDPARKRAKIKESLSEIISSMKE